MAAFQKFNSFVEAVAESKHNLGSDTLKVILSNSAPSPTDNILTDIAEIDAGNGYVKGGNTASVVSSAQTGGIYKLVLSDPSTWKAVGGDISPFRYAVLYNTSAANNELVGFWDYGSAVNLAEGDSFTVDFDPSAGVLTIA